MASGTIKAVVPKSDIVDNLTTNDSTKVLSAAQGYALNSNLTTLQSRTAATTATGIETTGTDVSLPGNVGFVFFTMPRTASISWHYILSYSKQNGNVNLKWITEEPSGVTVVAGTNKITVSHSQSNGLNAFTMMASW